jgi:hypothetical protein
VQGLHPGQVLPVEEEKKEKEELIRAYRKPKRPALRRPFFVF